MARAFARVHDVEKRRGLSFEGFVSRRDLRQNANAQAPGNEGLVAYQTRMARGQHQDHKNQAWPARAAASSIFEFDAPFRSYHVRETNERKIGQLKAHMAVCACKNGTLTGDARPRFFEIESSLRSFESSLRFARGAGAALVKPA